MRRKLNALKALTTASLRMYFRNKGAVIFTLIMPLAFLAVFGFLSRSNNASINIDVTNYSHSILSHNLIDALKNVKALKVTDADENTATDQLSKGKVDLQIVIPKEFGNKLDSNGKPSPSSIITRYNSAKPQNGQAANLIVSQIVSGMNAQINQTPAIITVDSSGVQTNNLNYFDFILPGIMAMTIMQLGIFGVAFAFVSLKANGSLRRLQATPTHPRNFIFAQAITRLVITLLTMAILLGLGIKIFNFHMIGGHYLDFSLVVILGIIVFLGFGFGIAGWAKDENQVAPIANLIQLPMLFLSGIFFPRDAFPAWLKTVTDFFPLTYLSDAMHHIANEGATLSQVSGSLLGLIVWGIIIFVLAINLFRWE